MAQDIEFNKNEDQNKQKLSMCRRAFLPALLLIALGTCDCRAQAFSDLIGSWGMQQLWMDTTQMFDADDDRVAMQRMIERQRQMSPGAALPDSAAMLEYVKTEFQEFKQFTITIHPDSSFTRTGFGYRGATNSLDSGRVVLEEKGWVLIDAGTHGDRMPIVLAKEGLTFTGPGPRVIKMVFGKNGQ